MKIKKKKCPSVDTDDFLASDTDDFLASDTEDLDNKKEKKKKKKKLKAVFRSRSRVLFGEKENSGFLDI
jgi:hypothetical protein